MTGAKTGLSDRRFANRFASVPACFNAANKLAFKKYSLNKTSRLTPSESVTFAFINNKTATASRLFRKNVSVVSFSFKIEGSRLSHTILPLAHPLLFCEPIPNSPMGKRTGQEIPPELQAQLKEFRRHLWRSKVAEALLAGFFGLLFSFLL
ncbi:MAG: hypothetical protein AAGC74_14675, partial [Verrucomicrobiota bacterium]